MPSRSFVVEDTLTAIEKHSATFVVLSPPMVHAIAKALRERPIDTSSVQTIQIGGDAVTKDVLLRCSALFPQSQVCVVHGMSEGVAAYRWEFFDRPVSEVPFLGESTPVGYVASGSEVKLWDPVKQRIADRGEAAEMHISSPSIIQHYLYGRSESSFYEADSKRWFVTGDIAMMNASGLVYVLGRSKDVIWRAGKAIMPAVVESSIEKLTGQQACVVGIKHASLGQQPYAVVAEDLDSELDVITHVQAVFGPACVLSGVLSLRKIGLSQFPVNATFKIIRQDVEQALISALGWTS
ncbi:hypothetical protein AMS68_004775 [Peltaster fructicola]|uniref:AMP-dependent synthetase/ligase domain-containing protein n=1 Tax=Peltaster fructicola TaxID=286661 RepID=A0A6H0XXD4_9PEZI|nr:hypothetical protein AMS68_004775 [Peltaster fructicola]